MRVRILLLFIFKCLAFQSLAQHGEEIDSLKALTKSRDQKSVVDAYNELSDHHWHNAPKKAIAYADSAHTKARQIIYPKGLIKAYENKGVAAYTLGQYDSAAYFYQQAIAMSKETGIESRGYLLYVNLLKKKGDFNQVWQLAKQLDIGSKDIKETNPLLITALADAFVELGHASLAKKYLQLVVGHPFYEKESARKADFKWVLAKYLTLTNRYDSAAEVVDQSVILYKEYDDIFGLARANLQMGSIELILGNIKNARELYTRGLNLYDSLDYSFGIAEAKRHLGTFYSTISEYGKASELLFESLEIFEEQGNPNEMAKIYNELAWIHYNQQMMSQGSEYIEKAIEIGNKVGNKSVVASGLNIYGIILDNEGKHKEALKKYNKALELRSSIGDKKGLAATLYNIAFIKEEDGEYDEAETMYLEAYEIEKEIGNALGAAISEYTLGSLYTKTGQFDLAEDYLNESRVKLKRLESKSNLLYNYLYSARLYERKGNYQLANNFYKGYIDLKDSLTDEKIRAQITELEIKYDLKNKDREIEFLSLESKTRDQELVLKEQTIRNQRLFIGFVAVLGGMLLIFLFAGYRLLKLRGKANEELKKLNREIQEKNEEITAQSEELQEANTQISIMNQSLEGKVGARTKELKKAYKELDTFFYRSSHDFRRPLTTFLGLAEVAKSTLTDPYSLDLFKKVEITALQLDKMVHKLKAVSVISDDSLRSEEFYMEYLIDKSLNKWSNQIAKSGVVVEKELSVKRLQHYPDLIEIILDNLIENSIQYNNSSEPKLRIEVNLKNKQLILKVEDNGVGIPPEYHEQIFDMYFRANETSMGNGLGLYLVRKSVDRLKGTIKLKSLPGKGTSFNITIPQH